MAARRVLRRRDCGEEGEGEGGRGGGREETEEWKEGGRRERERRRGRKVTSMVPESINKTETLLGEDWGGEVRAGSGQWRSDFGCRFWNSAS